ncbi:unnamed protein product, partial [Effrenium voratum]
MGSDLIDELNNYARKSDCCKQSQNVEMAVKYVELMPRLQLNKRPGAMAPPKEEGRQEDGAASRKSALKKARATRADKAASEEKGPPQPKNKKEHKEKKKDKKSKQGEGKEPKDKKEMKDHKDHDELQEPQRKSKKDKKSKKRSQEQPQDSQSQPKEEKRCKKEKDAPQDKQERQSPTLKTPPTKQPPVLSPSLDASEVVADRYVKKLLDQQRKAEKAMEQNAEVALLAVEDEEVEQEEGQDLEDLFEPSDQEGKVSEGEGDEALVPAADASEDEEPAEGEEEEQDDSADDEETEPETKDADSDTGSASGEEGSESDTDVGEAEGEASETEETKASDKDSCLVKAVTFAEQKTEDAKKEVRVTHKKEWDAFCRSAATKTFPASLASMYQQKKTDLFELWLDGGKTLMASFPEAKYKALIAKRRAAGLFYEDEDFPGDEQETWFYMPAGHQVRRDDRRSEQMAVKGRVKCDQEMLNAMVKEDGPLAGGALPAVVAATEAGKRKLHEVVTKESVAAAKKKPRAAEESNKSEPVKPKTPREIAIARMQDILTESTKSREKSIALGNVEYAGELVSGLRKHGDSMEQLYKQLQSATASEKRDDGYYTKVLQVADRKHEWYVKASADAILSGLKKAQKKAQGGPKHKRKVKGEKVDDENDIKDIGVSVLLPHEVIHYISCVSWDQVREECNKVIADLVAWSLKHAASGLGPTRGFYDEPFAEGSNRAHLAGAVLANGYRAAYFSCKADLKARMYLPRRSLTVSNLNSFGKDDYAELGTTFKGAHVKTMDITLYMLAAASHGLARCIEVLDHAGLVLTEDEASESSASML